MTQRPLRVLNLVYSLGMGGIERFLLRLIQSLDRNEWEMQVACKGRRRGGLQPEYEALGVTVHACPQSFFNPITWFRLYRLIRRGQYDVVCDYTGDFGGIPLLLARVAGVGKRIAWYRSAGFQYKPGIRTFYAAVVRWILKNAATDLLSNSTANLDAFHADRLPEDHRFEVIPNGIPVEQFAPDPQRRKEVRSALGIAETEPVIGHVGSFRLAKNHEAFVRAAKLVHARVPSARFVLVGDGSLRSGIEAMTSEQGLADRFLFLGNRSDVPDLLRAMDAFYFPSLYEGLPNALIEAMLAGLPFVASHIPPVREAIPDACVGWLVDPYDYATAAALLVAHLTDPPHTLAELARARCVEHYAMDKVVIRVARRMRPSRVVTAQTSLPTYEG